MDPSIIIAAYTKTVELLILILQDQPPEERRKAWARWFKFWEPVWKALGLDVKELEPPPAK